MSRGNGQTQWFCYLWVLFPWRKKNPQRRKIIHGMRPVGRKEPSIDLKIFW